MIRLAHVAALLLAACLFSIIGHAASADSTTRRVGVEERLGQKVASDVVFKGEDGTAVTVGELVKRPTIVSPVYHSCSRTCPAFLGGLADLLGRVDLRPGRDFTLLTISFDENDTPEIAAGKKKNYMKAIGKPFPGSEWRFLTGDRANIRRFADSVGFNFMREKSGFNHPVVLIVLSSDGTIVRYLYGKSFLPFDLTMAVSEASKGRTWLSVQRLLLFCYSYDSPGKTYAFNILKVYGTVIILFAISFFVYFTMTGRRSRMGIKQ